MLCTMGETEEFNTLTFEKKLMQLKDTQESIQGLSSWCLKQRAHHKKIVSSWLNVLKRVKVEQRLVLFYLANDVIQYSKRKNYEFVESWGLNLQKATPLVREEKVRQKILRIFKIWEQRSVYDDEFLSDLTGLLSAGAVKKTDDEAIDFQPQQLVNKIKQCSVLEADTDLRLKYIHDCPLPLSDTESLCASLKALPTLTTAEKKRRNKLSKKSSMEDVEKELNEGIGCVERYTQALQREIVAREALLALLTSANQYYSTQRGEVKVVAYAYKNFGTRVRTLKRKLDELVSTLPQAPSPPARDEDVPSPGPDEDLELPQTADDEEDVSYNIDKTFNTSLSADGSLYNLGLSSFLNTDGALGLFSDSSPTGAATVNSANKIEVINSRPSENQDFNINDFLKTLVPNDNAATSDNNSVTSGTASQQSQDALPGLDLLVPNALPPPPTSFYGSIINLDDEPYRPEAPSQWTNSNWNVPTTPVPRAVPPPSLPLPLPVPPPTPPTPPVPPPPAPPRAFAEAPASPPHAPVIIPENIVYQRVADPPPADVDQRGLLPPPPPPPALPVLGHMEDVDHRLLPPPPPAAAAPARHPVQQDVDHRNLISLTHQPPRPAGPRLAPPPVNLDQDYRVPPMVPPTDIVESVDMDLSEDEDQQGLYPGPAEPRRASFNNKVLVGGPNGRAEPRAPRSAPAAAIPNPFDGMPHDLNSFNMPFQHSNNDDRRPRREEADPRVMPMLNPFDSMPDDLKPFNTTLEQDFQDQNEEDAYEEDLRSRGLENPMSRELRNPSPPYSEYNSEWGRGPPPGQRFPRNWGPRGSPRPFGPPFWPRNGPRTPNRWMGPRPQRFW